MAGENDPNIEQDIDSALDTQLEADIDRFFAGPTDADAGDEPPPAETEDTPDEGPADDAEDTDDDEAGADDETEEGDKTDEHEEEEEEEEDGEEEEEEEEILTVTAEERKAIEDNPTLKKYHRLMQADYTRKTQALSVREEAVSRIEGVLRDPDKSADYLASIYKRQPTVAAAALEKVATGELAADFLVAVGVQSPEVFEKAYDRVRGIVDDPKERERWDREQSQQMREDAIARREQAARNATFKESFDKIHATASREAERLGFDEDETTELEGSIKELIRGRVKRDGSIDLTPQDVRKAVKDEKARLDRIYQRAQERSRKKLAQESQDRTKKKAERAKEKAPVGPSPTARKATKDRTRFKPPENENEDGLDAFAVHYFGGL